MRSAFLSFLVLLAVPGGASAAQVTIEVGPEEGVRYGSEHRIAGALTADGRAPLAGQEVVLEARAHPYGGAFQAVERATTDADGGFVFARALDRNHEVRVLAPVSAARSATVRAFTFPRTRLTYRQIRPSVVRLTQVYWTPRDVRLRGTSRLYVGSGTARTGRVRATLRPRRVRAGRYEVSAVVRIPASYAGRFQFSGCLSVDPGSALGDPAARCPRRVWRFDEG